MSTVVITDQEELAAALKDMLAQAEAGTLPVTALRVFNKDGTWEDMVLGGTPEEQDAALASLEAARRGAH